MADLPSAKLPPFSLEAENATLGSILLDSNVLARIADTLRAEHFYRVDNRTLYTVLLEMWQAGQPIDLVLARNELVARGLLEQLGGVDFLTGMIECVPSAENATYYARIVSEKALRREMITAVAAIDLAAYDGIPLTELMKTMEGGLDTVRQQYQALTADSYTMGDLIDRYPALREPIIDGLLRRGETMNVIGQSKMHKSWLVADLCLSVIRGDDWHTFKTQPGRVLLFDNELHKENLAYRLRELAAHRGIDFREISDRLVIHPLRGKLMDIYRLGNVIRSFRPGEFNLIVLDALYRFYPQEHDENSNANVTAIYNQIDAYADYSQAAFALIHHASKGLQTGKNVIDVGAGAGSQSRAADVHLVLRQHKEEDAVAVEAVVRSFKPIKPFCIRWQWPVWQLALDLNPDDLFTGKEIKDKPALTMDDLVRLYVPDKVGARRSDIETAATSVHGGRAHVRQLFTDALAEGLIHKQGNLYLRKETP